MRNILFFLLLSIPFFSCNQDKKKLLKDSFVIEGKISDANLKTIVLQKLDYNEVVTIDSVILNEEGLFRFTVKPLEKEIYLLRKNANHYISIIAEKSENLIIETAYESFEKAYTIKGSADNGLLWKLNNHLQKNLYKLDSLGEIWKSAINDEKRLIIKKRLDSCYMNIVADQRAFQLNLILNNTASMAALIALYLPLNREAVIKEETDFAVFEKVSNDLLKSLPENSHSINFAKKMKQIKMRKLEKELSQKENYPNQH